ncbi:hypothetical protein SEPCBS119000_001633 [Sporothrix epigloea]|uniref:SHSP domain-containing protein n=1 Tax=Sporothrix epigloea TaxID=1892477 RepID=A0ABP0DBT0_9PEZI
MNRQHQQHIASQQAQMAARQQMLQQQMAQIAELQRNLDSSSANFNPALEHFRSNLLFASVPPVFKPRFDTRETESSYEVYGELAGVDRKNISLVFPEPRTLEITGSVKRSYTLGAPVASSAASVKTASEPLPGAIAKTQSETLSNSEPTPHDGAHTPNENDDFLEIAAPSMPLPARSHGATVINKPTEGALERGKNITKEKSTVKAEVAEPDVIMLDAVPPQQKPFTPNERFTVQERSVGQFKRVFNFPVPVDEDNVRAHLENGILSVFIPKSNRKVRRIVVS